MLVFAIWIWVVYLLLCLGFCVFGAYITLANQWFVKNPICKKGNMFENNKSMCLLGPEAEIHEMFDIKMSAKIQSRSKLKLKTCVFFQG